jgi:Bacteriophage tail sheath protein
MTTPTLYPGVYVTEIPSGIRPITGVATSITAFLGRALKGPVNKPVVVNGFADYQRIFGGLWPNSTVSFVVADFFANGGGQALVVRLASADAIASTITVSGLQLAAASPGTWSAGLTVTIAAGSTDPDVAKRYGVQPSDLFNLTVTDTTSGQSEFFPNLTVLPQQARNVQHVLEEESVLLTVAGQLPTATPASGTGSVGTEGTDGGVLSDNDYVGGTLQAQHQGLWALDEADLFNLLCIPPPTLDEADQTSPAVYSAALGYCVTRRALLIVDPPTALTKDNAIAQLGELGLTGTAARNAALYYPRLREPDPTAENRLRTFVPCGAVAGVMARTDAARGVWKAPAGIDATLAGVSDLTVILTNDENGELNPLGVNCLRSFPVIGRVVWGARTLRGADELADEYKYVPVRRLALFLEESLYRGTQWVVFEPNDEPLWAQIRLNLGAFMQGLFRQGAFQGSTPQAAYFVKCDAETTTPNDQNLGRVNILVGFAPLRPAEFVVLQIQQMTQAQA